MQDFRNRKQEEKPLKVFVQKPLMMGSGFKGEKGV